MCQQEIAKSFIVTILFDASVDARCAYATGVLVLMSPATFAVSLSVNHHSQGRKKWGTLAFSLITLVFIYTTIVNIIERPNGIKIATFFISAILITSLISRVMRSQLFYFI